jgi:ribonucleoside-diphosphate reductase alpha chain
MPFSPQLTCGRLLDHRRLQKWIAQSHSANLFCGESGMRPLSQRHPGTWRKNLKTTCDLRTRSASNIEKADVEVKKEMRGIVGQDSTAKPSYTEEQIQACSLEAMRNGETCEACQ